MTAKRPIEDSEISTQSDTKAPKTRLTRACAECKKHKIKCEVPEGQTACVKCTKSGIECVPFNFAQKFIDDDTQWKSTFTEIQTQLKNAVQCLLRHNQLPDLSSFNDDGSMPLSAPKAVTPKGPPTSRSLVDPPTDISGGGTAESGAGDDNGLVTAPMRNLHTLTQNATQPHARTDSVQPQESTDFIAQGLVTGVEAEYLFSQYRQRLNNLLWAGVLCPYPDLDHARRSSTLLTAAVLTVAALHTTGHQESLQVCYEVFTSLVRDASMARHQSLDDIRGLCIGAFYINSLSWRLCGLAIRIATEVNLHMAFRDLIRGQSEARESVRLWYVLYICDHQFSIAHGRPPIMFNDAAIRGVDRFLASPAATPGDIRLSAQLSLWPILTEAYLLWGTDPELELTDPDYEKLQSFSIAVEQWRQHWRPRSRDIPLYGAYPSKGVVLYYHFALFQLNCLALRGISTTTPGQNASGVNLSWDRREAANVAINSARSTLRLIVEDSDLRKALIGVPIFTHTMIAMCATFLVKMAVAFAAADPESIFRTRLIVPKDLAPLGLTFNTMNVLSLVTELTQVLQDMTRHVSQAHLASHINAGVRALLARFQPTDVEGEYRYTMPFTGEGLETYAPPEGPRQMNTERSAHTIWPHEQMGVVHNLPVEDAQKPPVGQQEPDLGPMMGSFDWKLDEDFLWPATNGDDADKWFSNTFNYPPG